MGERGTRGMRKVSTFNVQRSTSNVQRPMANGQGEAFNVQGCAVATPALGRGRREALKEPGKALNLPTGMSALPCRNGVHGIDISRWETRVGMAGELRVELPGSDLCGRSQRPTFNVQRSMANVQLPTFNFQRSTSNVQWPMAKVKRSMFKGAQSQRRR